MSDTNPAIDPPADEKPWTARAEETDRPDDDLASAPALQRRDSGSDDGDALT